MQFGDITVATVSVEDRPDRVVRKLAVSQVSRNSTSTTTNNSNNLPHLPTSGSGDSWSYKHLRRLILDQGLISYCYESRVLARVKAGCVHLCRVAGNLSLIHI